MITTICSTKPGLIGLLTAWTINWTLDSVCSNLWCSHIAMLVAIATPAALTKMIDYWLMFIDSQAFLWFCHNYEKYLKKTSYAQCHVHTNCDTGIILSRLFIPLLPSQMVRVSLSLCWSLFDSLLYCMQKQNCYFSKLLGYYIVTIQLHDTPSQASALE